MSVCIINEKEYKIEIAKTPFATQWLRLFNNKSLPVKVGYNTDAYEKLSKVLTSHKNFFKKIKLQALSNIKENDLWDRKKLQELHLEIVMLQKNYKKSTNLANINTNDDWDYMHDYLHELEQSIRNNMAVFGYGEKLLRHDSKALTENWSWEPLMSIDDFYKSSDFDRFHINVPFKELGRHPYESFIFSPDTYRQEGSMLGQIGNNIEVQLVKTFPRPEKGYEEWCKQNNLPCVGTHFPLANFVNEKDVQEIIYTDSIKIKHD
tara:strand:- start:434 stop:1222 length:789 start_codon:yes stop_codon:yes gene_type:complete